MVETAKKEFVESLKRLVHIFNELKSVHSQQDLTTDHIKRKDAPILNLPPSKDTLVPGSDPMKLSPKSLKEKRLQEESACAYQER